MRSTKARERTRSQSFTRDSCCHLWVQPSRGIRKDFQRINFRHCAEVLFQAGPSKYTNICNSKRVKVYTNRSERFN